MRARPIDDRKGRAIQMPTVNANAPATNSPGTTGYPQVRYGRGMLGSDLRIRNIATTAKP